MKIARIRLATAATAAIALATLTACGSSGGSPGATAAGGSAGGGGSVTVSFLIDSAPATVASAKAVVDAFVAANPDVHIDTQTRPQGTEGDNLVKTKLATGDMADVFEYNSGSLLQALSPAKTLVDLTGDPALANVEQSFLPVVSQAGKPYGAPWGTAMGGGILYNKKVYAQLGLQVPKSWADFEANNEKIKAAGITPVISTFKDTWTSQLFVLGDYFNVQAAVPTFATDYTANKVKFATTPAALEGFQRLEEIKAKGYLNKGYGSATLDQGLKLLATGKGAQYPMLTFAVGQLATAYPAAAGDIGFFGIPGTDPAKNGATIWEPAGVYIPTTSKHVAAAKRFLAFIASPAGTDAFSKGTPPAGPYLVKGSSLPADALPVVKDLQAYIDAKATAPALEFLSPVKGPSLEQITVAVGSGLTSAADGAAQYDNDVTKQAKQLGLAGW